MSKNHYAPKFAFLAGLFSLAMWLPAAAMGQSAEQKVDMIKEEMGVAAMRIIHPAAGASLKNPMPGIAADPTTLLDPVDPSSVVVLLDGVDVTATAEVASTYIYYRPPAPLTQGNHSVSISATLIKTRAEADGKQTVERTPLQPLEWSFFIEGGKKPAQAAASGEKTAERRRLNNAHGRMMVGTDYVSAEADAPSPLVDVTKNYVEKEGWKLNTDLFFSNLGDNGSSLVGSFHRETQLYTDKEVHKLRFAYKRDSFEANAGDFWLAKSDLTVIGTELRGFQFKAEDGPMDIDVFAGRSIDPSTTGQPKQSIGGVSAAYRFNAQHRTTGTFIALDDKIRDQDLASVASIMETKTLAALLHEFDDLEGLKARLELGLSEGDALSLRPGGSIARHRSRQTAAILKANKTYEDVTAGLSAFSVDQNYLPVANGSQRFTESDRTGFSLDAKYRPAALPNLEAQADYESYNRERNGDQDVTRYSAFVAVSPTEMTRISARYNRLETDGFDLNKTEAVESQNDSVMVQISYTAPGGSILRNTRISAVYQRVELENAGLALAAGGTSRRLLAQTDLFRFSFATSLDARLGLRFSYGVSNTDNTNLVGSILSLAASETNTADFGLTYAAIPRVFDIDAGYQNIQTDGSGASLIDNEEDRFKLKFRYAVNKSYTLGLGLDFVDYTDSVTPQNSYNQDILRTSVEWSF